MTEKMKDLRLAFNAQKSGAKRRGIEFHFTFDEWLEWWGPDIAYRGKRAGCLQMQRFADSGPYAPGNVKKGYPKNNARTRAATLANRRAEQAKAERERMADAAMNIESKHDDGPVDEDISENGVIVRSKRRVRRFRKGA